MLFLAILSLALRSAALPPALDNGVVRATFGARGVTAVTDEGERRTYGIDRDGFAITIDGRRIDSDSLAAPVRTTMRDGRSVSYAWRAGPYEIDAVYELRPGWRFVSKQLFVRVPSGAAYHVDSVAPVRATLGEVPDDIFIPRTAHPRLGTADYGAALRFRDQRGLLVVIQNPFLHVTHDGVRLTIAYAPDMEWRAVDGAFVVDRALLAPYRLTGRRIPATMIPEWTLAPPDTTPGADESEIAAFADLVRAFLINPPAHPHDVFVGWTANDYQIDVARPAGRAEYERLIDRAAQLGARDIVYAPSNSALSVRDSSVDDWKWEHVLWLALGQQIRKGAWHPATSAIPPSVSGMVAYARGHGVRLLAYVYPIVPFSEDSSWLVRRPGDSVARYATLASRALQDSLIDWLSAFYRRTGIGGYAFDYTFLDVGMGSRYAQWAGWRRVMETLKRRFPAIVFDGRQAYQLYGAWSWLAGSYPHPTSTDEQPESFVPFPDLHIDRVSADRERYTAYRYRNYEFAPSELVPGFMTHQTPRSDSTGDMPSIHTAHGEELVRFRARDWDYYGWRYSVLSSIAIAGWNNVIDMIPARDTAELDHFSRADIAWFRGWIDWTDHHREYLRHTRTILGQPAIGKVDGTSAIIGGRGYVFLFNPNLRSLPATVPLDATIGLQATGPVVVRELYPDSGRTVAGPHAGAFAEGDTMTVTLDGAEALVLSLEPAPAGSVVARQAAKPRVPPPAGRPPRSWRAIGRYDPTFAGGVVTDTFAIPERAYEAQLAAGHAWSLPWTAQDSATPWLVPSRRLLFVQIAEPDDKWSATLEIDGEPVPLVKAYSSIRPVPRDFVGFYADISGLAAGRGHVVRLTLPTLRPGQLQGVFLENFPDMR